MSEVKQGPLPAIPVSGFGVRRVAASSRTAVSIGPAALRPKATAMRWLFPLMLVNITVGNQLWMVGPFYIGQFIFWVVVAAASVVVARTFGWAWLLVGAVLGARAVESLTGAERSALLYLVLVNALFLLAGAVTAVERSELIQRQLRVFFALCVPLMFLQVAGVGAWTQALNTEYWDREEDRYRPKIVFKTLFVPYANIEDIPFGVGQGRPAGLLHSNNVLSLVILFGLATHLMRAKAPRITWADVILCAAMVLAMAKVVFVGFLALVGWAFVAGPRASRNHALRLLALVAGLFLLYGIFFPAVLASGLSLFKILFSVLVRVYDLIEVLNIDESRRQQLRDALAWTQNYVEGNLTYRYATEEDIGGLSGYAQLIGIWPYLVLLVIAALPLAWRGLSILRAEPHQRSSFVVPVLIVMLLYPAAVPFFRAQLYWYLLGFGLWPAVFSMVRHPYVRRPRPALSELKRRASSAVSAEAVRRYGRPRPQSRAGARASHT